MERLRQATAYVLIYSVLLMTWQAYAAPIYEPQNNPQGEAPPAPLSPTDLDNLVAPIALYPDALVAQILGAATYPDQVSAANAWLHQNSGLKGDALLQAVDPQPWDPSVKALTQFPSVLDNMAQNLSWTSALGEAAYNQQGDVMASVQRLRKQAKAAGNLKTTSQQVVVQQDPQTIVIQPANPQVVYVPTYNPTVVYGTPYSPPGYSTGALVATGLISFGVGMAVGAAINNSHYGWGWGGGGWGCNWHGGNTVYHNNVYVSRSNVYANGNRYNANNVNRANYNNVNRSNNNVNRNVNTANKSGNTININGDVNTGNVNNRNSNNAAYGTNRTNNTNNANRTNNTNNVNRASNTNNVNRTNNTNNRTAGGNQAANTPATRPTAADRGYGQANSGTKSGALSGQSSGGTARAESNRGKSSVNGGATRQAPAARGGRKR